MLRRFQPRSQQRNQPQESRYGSRNTSSRSLVSRNHQHATSSRIRSQLSRVLPGTITAPRFANGVYIYDANSDTENIYKMYFELFFIGYQHMLYILEVLFIVILVCTEILEDHFREGVITLQVCLGIAALYLLKGQIGTRSRSQRGFFTQQVFEIILLIVFLFMIKERDPKETSAKFAIFLTSAVLLFISHFIKMCWRYIKISSIGSKFCEFINSAIIILKFILLLQAIFILIQLSLSKQLDWFIVFIPGWTFCFIVFLFLLKVAHLFIFSLGRIICNQVTTSKKRTTAWIFGNLICCLALTIVGMVFVVLRYDCYEDPLSFRVGFIVLYVVILLVCGASSLYCYYYKAEISEFCKQIFGFFEMQIEDINIQLDQIERNNVEILEKKAKEKKEAVQYVIKISNSYYKAATVEEVAKLKGKRGCLQMKLERAKPLKPEEKTPQEGTAEKIDKKESKDGRKCVVCFNKNADAVFMDCGHGGICFDCSLEMIKSKNECHMCRTHVSTILGIQLKNYQRAFFKVNRRVKPEKPEREERREE